MARKKKDQEAITPEKQRILDEISEETEEECLAFLHKWERSSKRGQLRYIALHGLLPFGLGIIALMGGFIPFMQSGWDILFFKYEGYLFRMVLIIVIAYIAGYYAGRWLWKHHELKYAILRERYPKVATPWDDPELLSPPEKTEELEYVKPANKKKK